MKESSFRKGGGKESSIPLELRLEAYIKNTLRNKAVQTLFRTVSTVTDDETAKQLRVQLADIARKVCANVHLVPKEAKDDTFLLMNAFIAYRELGNQKRVPLPQTKKDLIAIWERGEVFRIQKEIKDLPLENLPSDFPYDDFTSPVLTQSEIAEQFIACGRGDLVVDYFTYRENNQSVVPNETAMPSAALLERIKEDDRCIQSVIEYSPVYFTKVWFQKFVLALLPNSILMAEKILDLKRSGVGGGWVEEGYEQAKYLIDFIHLEAIERQTALLEKENLFSLSKRDFRKCFPYTSREGTGISQANVGNCYLVSFIDALRRWPHFEMVCRLSIRRDEEGKTWNVSIPLMNKKGTVVTITDKELGVDHKGIRPLAGGVGYQVLEAAYIKGTFKKMYRKASQSGHMHKPLNFFDPDAFTHSKQFKKTIGAFLRTFDPDIHLASIAGESKTDVLATSCSVRQDGSSVEQTERLIGRHAYTIIDVDREAEVVFIANPHDTRKIFEVPFEEFKQFVYRVDVARVNNHTILQRIEDLENRAKESSTTQGQV